MPVSVEYYRDKATQCCKKAAKTSDPIDKQAWTRLAVAWMALVELRDARHLPPSLGVSRGRYLAVLLAFCDGNRHRRTFLANTNIGEHCSRTFAGAKNQVAQMRYRTP